MLIVNVSKLWTQKMSEFISDLTQCVSNTFQFRTYNVGAARTEGEGATGVDVGGVQELQHTDEVGTVGLQRETQKTLRQSPGDRQELDRTGYLPFSFLSWSIVQGLCPTGSSPAGGESHSRHMLIIILRFHIFIMQRRWQSSHVSPCSSG